MWASEKYIMTEVFNPEKSAVSLQREQSVSSQQSYTVLGASPGWGAVEEPRLRTSSVSVFRERSMKE